MATTTDQQTDSTDTNDGVLAQWTRGVIKNDEQRDRLYRALFYVAAGFFLVTTLFPFYWLLVLALTPNSSILSGDWSLPGLGIEFPHPQGFNVGAFVEVFQQVPFHLYIFNSFVLATTTTIIVLLIASLAGYVFGRLEFPGRGPLMLGVLMISYFPPAAFLIPLFDAFLGNAVVIPFLGIELFEPPRLVNTPGSMIMPFSALFLPLAIHARSLDEIDDDLAGKAGTETWLPKLEKLRQRLAALQAVRATT